MNKLIERKFKKYLLKSENLTWEQYIERFEGTKPLELDVSGIYPDRLSPSDGVIEYDGKEFWRYEIFSGPFGIKKLDFEYKIQARFKRKVKKEEIESLPYLNIMHCSLKHLLHRRVIEIMQKICPDDFEIMPVTLVNSNQDSDYFEIKDFFEINLFNCINAIDIEKSIIDEDNDIVKFRYKENPWQDGARELIKDSKGKILTNSVYKYFPLEKPCHIAIDAMTGVTLYHPELVKQLPHDSYHEFCRDEDQLRYNKEID